MKPADSNNVPPEPASHESLEQVKKELKKKAVQITILKKIIAENIQSSPNPKKT
jgi:hypothetical protein